MYKQMLIYSYTLRNITAKDTRHKVTLWPVVALPLLYPISALLCKIAPKKANSSKQAGQCMQKILAGNALDLGLADVLISTLK